MKRVAVVLMNLGGPDKLSSVKPFLFNLFKDPAILSFPYPFRWLLAKIISHRRTPEAQEIYKLLGGKSPLLENTQAQASLLEKELRKSFSKSDSLEVKVFIAMRYWHPFIEEAVRDVLQFNPTEVLLVPLYPQFSTTTTGSSMNEWDKQAQKKGLRAQTKSLCCYPTEENYIKCLKELTEEALKISRDQSVRILFSAHGLPKKVIEKGDPYQSHVEKTASAVMASLGSSYPSLDWVVCYQSRVGPLEWIGPHTDQEIKRAGKEKKGLILVPVSFVSEHSETLVELDVQYRELAQESGVPFYARVSTPSIHPFFIKNLVDLIKKMIYSENQAFPQGSNFTCDAQFCQCFQLK